MKPVCGPRTRQFPRPHLPQWFSQAVVPLGFKPIGLCEAPFICSTALGAVELWGAVHKELALPLELAVGLGARLQRAAVSAGGVLTATPLDVEEVVPGFREDFLEQGLGSSRSPGRGTA